MPRGKAACASAKTSQPPAALGPTQRGMEVSLLKVWAPCALFPLMNWKVWQSFPSPPYLWRDNLTQPEFSRGWSHSLLAHLSVSKVSECLPRVFSSKILSPQGHQCSGPAWCPVGCREMKASSHEIRILKQRADVALYARQWDSMAANCQGSEEESTGHINSRVSGV